MNWLEIVKVIGPLVLQLIPALAAAFHPAVISGIVDAEQTGKPGPEKLNDVLSHPELNEQDAPAIIKGVNKIVEIANALSNVQKIEKGE